MKKILGLVAILCGLCAPAQANTTAVMLAQQGGPATGTVPSNHRTYDITQPIPAESVMIAPDGAPTVRIALLLPLHSDALARAADAVRNGFQAAYQSNPKNIIVNVIETDETTADVLAAYAGASATYDIVVGPLTRSGVTAIAQRGFVSKPTIALTQAEPTNGAETLLPQNMLSMGLSVEDEARQTANTLIDDMTELGNAFVVSGSAAWQKRAANAFAAQSQQQGRRAQVMELSVSDGVVSPSGLLQLRKRLQAEKPSMLFVALDAGQAAQLRSAIGSEVPIYGTSQLNPLTLDNRVPTDAGTELNGVYLLDIPWQLQPDHPAVMIYPHPEVAADQKRSADLERLYALGIDAYRVALEIALQRSDFDIDGVTGRLSVSFGYGRSRFDRAMQPAMYQNGIVVPLLDRR